MTRPGVALLAALSLVALLGLIVAGAFATASVARRAGDLTHTDATLTFATDFTLNSVVADWQSLSLGELVLGETRVRSVNVGQPGMDASVAVTRLPGEVFWIVAEVASSSGVSGRRRASLILRRDMPLLPRAGLVARGDVRLGSQVQIERDTSHGPDCPAVADATVMLGPGARLRRPDAYAGDSIETIVTSAAADSAIYALAGAGWSTLLGRPGVTYLPADADLSGVVNGIVLVAGRLRITGAFAATGLIVARDGVESSPSPVTIVGALLSFGEGQDPASVDLPNAVIRYSPCTVVRAFSTTATPRPVRGRSWAELF